MEDSKAFEKISRAKGRRRNRELAAKRDAANPATKR